MSRRASVGPAEVMLDFSLHLCFSCMSYFLFSQDVELIKDEGNHSKKITPKPPDSFFNGIPSISLEEPDKSLDNSAKTIENDLIYVLRSHLAKMQKILQKERE